MKKLPNGHSIFIKIAFKILPMEEAGGHKINHFLWTSYVYGS